MIQAIKLEVNKDIMRTDIFMFILLLCILSILITLIIINL